MGPGQLEVPGRTAQLLKDEVGPRGTRALAAEPQRLLTMLPLHPSYKLGTGLGRRLGVRRINRRLKTFHGGEMRRVEV